jgi:hypothetical protein
MKLCDKRLICVEPCCGLALNEEYRAIQRDDTRYRVMDSNGAYVWRSKLRFVVKGERV